jgi:hypothetical protein
VNILTHPTLSITPTLLRSKLRGIRPQVIKAFNRHSI